MRDKTYINSISLRELISRELSPYCGTVFSLYVADGEYYCPPVSDVEAILKGSKVAEDTYILEAHDCDDFSHLAMAAFIRDAYREGNRRPAYCFGIVFSLGHAFNWFVSSNLEVYLVEPQTAKISKLDTFPKNDCITFMLV